MNGVDLYSGAGGMLTGHRIARPGDVMTAIDFEKAPCETAEAAGYRVIQADLLTFRPSDFLLYEPRYVHASPPCGGFTIFGKGGGKRDIPLLLSAVKEAGSRLSEVGEIIDDFEMVSHDPRSSLSLEPLRWIAEFMPDYVSLEQVPAVLPLWRAYGEALTGWGYDVWVGYLFAEQFGTPQVRKRSILMASRIKKVRPPAPTHSQYHKFKPARLDPGVPRWVTMAEGLDWPRDHPLSVNNQTGQDFDLTWPWRRPSLAVTGARIVPMPGDYRKRSKNDGILVTPEEAAALQGFPKEYPFKGSEGAVRTQIGNAVPVPLAAAVVEELLK